MMPSLILSIPLVSTFSNCSPLMPAEKFYVNLYISGSNCNINSSANKVRSRETSTSTKAKTTIQ